MDIEYVRALDAYMFCCRPWKPTDSIHNLTDRPTQLVVTFDVCVDSDSTASSSSTPSSSFLMDDFWFDLKIAPDGTPVPHSSTGELVNEGSGVDITEGRGTVEPDGECLGASGLLRDERCMDVFGSVSIPKFRFFF